MSRSIILFDGVCNLCSSSVQFILSHESNQLILFASLQSDAGKALLAKHNVVNTQMQSMFFIENGKLFAKSAAAFQISMYLKPPWNLFSKLKFLPVAFTDAIYDLIARNRYKVFGKKEKCWVPDVKWKDRFLDM